MENNIGYTDKQIQELLEGIHSGEINPYALPEDLYNATAKYLLGGVDKGMRAERSFEFGTADEKLAAELRENIYMFSAAKTYHQVNQMGSLILDGDNIRPFSEFKADAMQMFGDFNQAWAETEYNTAIGMAQNAVRWGQIEERKEVLPNLRYSAVMDANTSEECAALNGTTAPVEDEIWDTCMPPNHFNCRCVVEQLDEDAKVDSQEDIDAAKKQSDESKQDVFKMNAGKDKVIFSDEHPYFEVASRDKELAERNFDLPIPE